MKQFKKIQIESKNLKVGDIVFTEKKNDLYLILKENYTFWLRHKFFTVVYLSDGDSQDWFLDELSTTKTIYRLFEVEK